MPESRENVDEHSGADRVDVKKVRLAVLGALAAAGVVILAIVLLGGDSGEDSSSGAEAESEVVALSEAELLAEASGLGGPAYWIGPRAGTESYELTTTGDGRIYVRYLTGDAGAGDERADFLSVGTYPFAEAEAGLQRSARAGEGTLERGQGYEILLSSSGTGAYVVFDDEPSVQVEIYSPQPGEAEQLARDGALKPLG